MDSCGDVTLGQGENIPDAAIACMDSASSTGAELAVVRPTTEGDPVVTFYRVGPGIEGMEVFTDFRNDRWGSGLGWTHQLCLGTTTILQPTDCRDA